MSPVIRIEEEVYEGLKTLAKPFEDTPNTVIRRLLEDIGTLVKSRLSEDEQAKTNGIASEGRTSQEEFRLPILQVLDEIGGGSPKEVLKRVGEKMKSKLTRNDWSKTPQGGTGWRVYARWMRHRMKREGLLSGSHGHWEITEKGRALLKKERGK